ncbi:MAG: hypothetical protein Fur0028_05670 [Bacteroidales bacterium]
MFENTLSEKEYGVMKEEHIHIKYKEKKSKKIFVCEKLLIKIKKAGCMNLLLTNLK